MFYLPVLARETWTDCVFTPSIFVSLTKWIETLHKNNVRLSCKIRGTFKYKSDLVEGLGCNFTWVTDETENA